MTKAEEIKLLQETIARFGPESYIGPWLNAYRFRIETDIRSDFRPEIPMPADARHEAAAILADAEEQRKRIIEAAERKAKTIETAATDYTVTIRRRAIAALERSAAELSK